MAVALLHSSVLVVACLARTVAPQASVRGISPLLRNVRCSCFSLPLPPAVQLTKSWAQENTVLIGDACHPMMPNLGQGGCQAMEDGYMLTNMLKDVRGGFDFARGFRCSAIVSRAELMP